MDWLGHSQDGPNVSPFTDPLNYSNLRPKRARHLQVLRRLILLLNSFIERRFKLAWCAPSDRPVQSVISQVVWNSYTLGLGYSGLLRPLELWKNGLWSWRDRLGGFNGFNGGRFSEFNLASVLFMQRVWRCSFVSVTWWIKSSFGKCSTHFQGELERDEKDTWKAGKGSENFWLKPKEDVFGRTSYLIQAGAVPQRCKEQSPFLTPIWAAV